MKKLLISVGVAVALAVVWYLLSPLFFDTIVDEQLSPSILRLSDAEKMKVEEIESLTPAQVEVAEPTIALSGTFKDADSFHRGSGKATLYILSDGKRVLRFEDFTVTNGPALSVYLVRSVDGNVDSGFLDIGKLKGNRGNQNYEIPADTDLSAYHSVIIWCVPFSVTFAIALLQ